MKEFIQRHQAIIYFNLCVLVFSFWLFGQWPGYYIGDTFVSIQTALLRTKFDWQSYIYAFYIKIMFFLTTNLAATGLIQILLFSCIFSWIHSWSVKKGAPIELSLFCLAILLLSPIHSIYTLFYSRDPLHGWLNLLLVFLIFKELFVLKKGDLPRQRFVLVIIFLACILTELRQDSLLFVPAVCFIFLFYYPKKTQFIKQFLLPSVAFYSIICIIIPNSLSSRSISNAYKLTAILNPLGYIVSHVPPDSLSIRDKESIEGVVSLSDLKKHHTNYEIPVFHKRLININATADQANQFTKTYIKLILQHPILFLKNRIILFFSNLGLDRHTMYYVDDLSNLSWLSKEQIQLMKKYEIFKMPISSGLQKLQTQYANNIIQRHYGAFLQILLASSLGGFLLVFIGIGLFKLLPLTSLISILLMSRIIVVFLAAPASQLKYTYSLMLSFIILPVLIFCEIKQKYKGKSLFGYKI